MSIEGGPSVVKNQEQSEQNVHLEREKKIATLFEKGLDDEEIIAYHGTTLSAIKKVIETGGIPTGSEGEQDYIYFVRLDDEKETDKFEDQSHADYCRAAAESYAALISQRMEIMEQIGQEIQENPDYFTALREFLVVNNMIINDKITEQELFRYCHPDYLAAMKGIIELIGFPKLKEVLISAVSKKGVIIGLNRKIFDLEPESVYHTGDEGWRVHVPQGLSMDYFSGLGPVGQDEYEYFEKLQEKYES